MNNHIFISVVLSTYNDSRYIKRAIQSVLDQSYPYFELIIVNDGSTDNTLDIINTFNDKRIIVINKENTGLTDSLNVGIAHAKYDWIARMDGDDISLPNRFENQVKLIKKDIGVIGGQYIKIDENDVKLSTNCLPRTNFMIKMRHYLGYSCIVHPSALINKKYIEECQGYDTNFITSQDYDLWLMLSNKCKFVNTKEQILLFRKHAKNISAQKKDIQFMMSLISQAKHRLGIDHAINKDSFIIIKNEVELYCNCHPIKQIDSQTSLLKKRWLQFCGILWKFRFITYFVMNRQKFLSNLK